MVLCVISLLTIYMAFLHLLDPWITKRRQTAYKQHAEEEVGQLFLPRTIIFLMKRTFGFCMQYFFITIIEIANTLNFKISPCSISTEMQKHICPRVSWFSGEESSWNVDYKQCFRWCCRSPGEIQVQMGRIAPTRFVSPSFAEETSLIDISPPLLKRLLSRPILEMISFFLSHNYLSTTKTKCLFTNNKDYVNCYASVMIINWASTSKSSGGDEQSYKRRCSSKSRFAAGLRNTMLYNVWCFTTSLTLCSCTTWKRVVSASWNSLSGSLEAAGSRSAKKNLRPAPNAQLNNFHFPQILNVKTFTSNWKARVFLITRAWIWRPFLDFMNETITSRLCCDLTGALQRRLSFSYIR